MTVRNDDIKRIAGTGMTSDPGDPHGWRFDCEVLRSVNEAAPHPRLKAWWVCLRCGTTVRVSSDVTRRPHSGNSEYDEVVALSELRSRADAERATVHPRCSEVRLVKEVVES